MEDDTSRINWQKLKRLSKLLRPIEDWKRCQLTTKPNERIRKFLFTTSVWHENELYIASYKREAPLNDYERKEQVKLKTEHPKTEPGVSTLKRLRQMRYMHRNKTL